MLNSFYRIIFTSLDGICGGFKINYKTNLWCTTDARYWMLDAGYSLLDNGYRIFDA